MKKSIFDNPFGILSKINEPVRVHYEKKENFHSYTLINKAFIVVIKTVYENQELINFNDKTINTRRMRFTEENIPDYEKAKKLIPTEFNKRFFGNLFSYLFSKKEFYQTFNYFNET